MSGVHDDLVTLRRAGWLSPDESAALDRVEAEIARLREESESNFAEERERCARLQQALDETLKIARRVRGGDNVGEEWYATTEYADNVLREALAGLDTPADSQEDKT